uniref:E2 ubiquitin-conjugating enzyme n=1 Tax=Setaria digitata TaxID=48799 RepID=A0A915Q5J0_9BILA
MDQKLWIGVTCDIYLKRSPVEGFSAGLRGDVEDIYKWEVVVLGPADTPYEGGVFRAILDFPTDYPQRPPKMRFISKIWHPNIDVDGNVCISILHEPGDDRYGYERPEERWLPVHTVETILLSVISMLADPNYESPANVDAAKMLRENYSAFKKKVAECVRRTQEERWHEEAKIYLSSPSTISTFNRKQQTTAAIILVRKCKKGVLGQQVWLSPSVAHQNRQSQREPSSEQQIQAQNLSGHSQRDLFSSTQQKIILTNANIIEKQPIVQSVSYTNNVRILRHESDMRHRDLPIASMIYQKGLNETRKIDSDKHMLSSSTSINSRFSYGSSSSMNRRNKSFPKPRHRSEVTNQRDISWESEPSKRPAERATGGNVRQKQEHLLEPQRFGIQQFGRTKVLVSVISNRLPLNISKPTGPPLPPQFVPSLYHLEQLSAAQQPQRPKISQLTVPITVSPQSKSANDVFLKCCKEKGVDSRCESRCNFDILDRRVLTAMFVGSDPCPRSNGRNLLSCAAQDSDHTNCCRASGVQQTAAGDKCLGLMSACCHVGVYLKKSRNAFV